MQSAPKTKVGKAALAKAIIGMVATITVGGFSIAGALMYQFGLSADTRDQAVSLRATADAVRVNGSTHEGVSSDELYGLAAWADRDATINEYAVGTTAIGQFMSAFNLVKGAGMVIGAGKLLCRTCCGRQEISIEKIQSALAAATEEQLDKILATFKQYSTPSKELLEYVVTSV